MSDCKLHTGYTRKVGHPYGDVKRGGKKYLAHRVAYCEGNNIPLDAIKGKVVRHKCDNPRCVNPDHLELGTQADNMHDMRDRKRAARGDQHYAAKLTREQVLYIREHCVPRHPTLSLTAFATQYGVSISVVHHAFYGTKWKV